ncbi:MAG: hypothetical protein IT298_01105 [Chloroflexi bacterium]|jgi:hypothetical protein|nr:hypothetical protein [Chloroflexota bacterium]
MADPIPRNSRAHETEEFRQARLNRERHAPPFGQNVAGVHRFRGAEPAAPHRPQPQAARPAEPRLGLFREMMNAARPAQAPGGAVARRPMAVRPRLYAVFEWARHHTAAAFGILLVVTVVMALAFRQPPTPAETATSTVFDPQIPALMASAPQTAPTEVCTVMSDRPTFIEPFTIEGQKVLIADIPVRALGCSGQLVRAALWVFRSPQMALTSPEAPAVYRGVGDQLTVQGVRPIDSDDQSVTLRLILPHAVFPESTTSPVWLTLVTQAWPDGRAASAGSRYSEPVFFQR